MPAAEKSSVNSIQTLGVIAGGGSLPGRLLHVCNKKKITPFVVGLEGQTDPSIIDGHNHLWARLGQAGKIIKTLQKHEVKDLVLIGSIHRPSLAELKPDLKTAQFYAKLGMRALGDNDLLTALRKELESEGFTIHGVHEFAEDLLMPLGAVGKYEPKKEDQPGIERALEASRSLGLLDVGQSVIVQQGMILGVEAAEGTDQLIKRCKHLMRKGRGGILVKTCKPQQDKDFDLPTIGPRTIKNAADSGLVGIVAQAGSSLLVEPEEVARLADKHKIFVIGMETEQ